MQIIGLIFGKTGAEAGLAKRVMDENLLSWGFFTDHNPFEPHCNAHANNFLVLDPLENSQGQLTAAIDFDLAYNWDTFVNTVQPEADEYPDPEELAKQQARVGKQDRV
eukprot:CAMPEP_0176396780 /NCGR_PEP_ID=MMETSP0126-20121128/44556_1 /TAXON_ID=141414 ORGANISM="Strombidinopsis acuminatum, Strain SPMC142" /NCGR_SAMPLE_ID=MMETSP0126 /ASSEMBLY_ACC=CAM_ASM_000229 /LENGTH=107 /DNA_ID=CAMNT_0017770611 /DNA_START=763 /DNA_END=1086 /DNA_ORIENTATION=+